MSPKDIRDSVRGVKSAETDTVEQEPRTWQIHLEKEEIKHLLMVYFNIIFSDFAPPYYSGNVGQRVLHKITVAKKEAAA